jgi:hypothetical protein
MRKLIAILLITATAITLTACGGGDESNNPPIGNNNTHAGNNTGNGNNNGNGGNTQPQIEGFHADMRFPEWIEPLLQGEVTRINDYTYFTQNVLEVVPHASFETMLTLTNISDRPVWIMQWVIRDGELSTLSMDPRFGDGEFVKVLPPGASDGIRAEPNTFMNNAVVCFVYVPMPDGFVPNTAYDLGNGAILMDFNAVLTSLECIKESGTIVTDMDVTHINRNARGIAGPGSDRGEEVIFPRILHESMENESARTLHRYLPANFTSPYVLWVCFNDETPMAIIRNSYALWHRIDSDGKAHSMHGFNTYAVSESEDTWQFLTRNRPESGEAMELRVYCNDTRELLETHTEDFISDYIPHDWGIDSVANNVFR